MGAATLAASLAAGLAVGLAFEAGLPGHCTLAPPSLRTYVVGFAFLFAGDLIVFALGSIDGTYISKHNEAMGVDANKSLFWLVVQLAVAGTILF